MGGHPVSYGVLVDREDIPGCKRIEFYPLEPDVELGDPDYDWVACG